MTSFKDFLNEQFAEDTDFENQFFAKKEKIRIALEIVHFREAAKLTQKQLADRIGTSQSAIARMENDNYHNYSIRVLRKIAEILDLELIVSLKEKHSKETTKDVRTPKIISLPGYGERKKYADGYIFEGIGNYLLPKKVVGG